MTFWFCNSCKKIWHSHIKTPDNVKKIRCFYCMKNASVRLKEDRLVDEKIQTRDYDKNTREFLKIKKKEIIENNHKKAKTKRR